MIGSQLGPYVITAKLGEGGMGEVYRATDAKLRREVAIKVLSAAFTADKERLARFEREAQLLASLNHPNIAAIYGLEESGGASGARALVMELVEGEDLSQRIGRGAIPLDEALAIARQIAEALEAAHEQGIVHRDLKPANVKLRGDGTVKVLDFGLAKAMESGSDTTISPPLLNSPTLTAPHGTQIGVILGTAAYMAPEQAVGGKVDRRADLWAFGVVLWEMLSGRRLFDGETVSHVLASVLKDEPDLSVLPAATPRKIRDLIRRCLRKKPRERLQAIGDARLVLEEVLAGASDEVAATPELTPVVRPRPAWQVALGLFAAAVLGALAAGWFLPQRPFPATPLRTLSELPTPAGMEATYPALSPDGTMLAMRAADTSRGISQIWIRNLATGEMRAVAGTENGSRPFWSTDGRAIGYFDTSENWIKRVDLEGGRPVRLVRIGSGRQRGVSWGANTILYCDPASGAILRVAPTGGEPVEIIRPGKDEFFAFPTWLVDGRSFLYLYYVKDAASPVIRVRNLESGEERDLIASDLQGIVSGARLYYGRGTALLARDIDLDAGKLVEGEAEIIAEGVDDATGGQFTVAAGLLVYSPVPEQRGSRITIYDRTGKAIDRIDADAYLDDLSISSDGRHIALMKEGAAMSNSISPINIWGLDLERRIFDRLSYGDRDDDPVFSPDGTRIAFAHDRDLFVKPANGSGDPVLVTRRERDIVTNDWTVEGLILYTDITEEGSEDLFAISPSGGEPRRLTKTPFNEHNAVVSPDGRWLAYASDESGDWQVYLTAWPSLDGKWRVSSDKAAMPRWRRDGKELFFLGHDQRLMSATVEAGGSAPVLGLPKPLFAVHRHANYIARTSRWAVTPDGERFLVLEPLQENSAANHPFMLMTSL